VVETSVSGDLLGADQVVTVRVAVTNYGPWPVDIIANRCPERFVVRDGAGNHAAPLSYACQTVLKVRSLGYGESYVVEEEWRGYTGRTDLGGTALPDGTYYVIGYVEGLDFARHFAEPIEVRIDRASP
jgi:hypothetical protein